MCPPLSPFSKLPSAIGTWLGLWNWGLSVQIVWEPLLCSYNPLWETTAESVGVDYMAPYTCHLARGQRAGLPLPGLILFYSPWFFNWVELIPAAIKPSSYMWFWIQRRIIGAFDSPLGLYCIQISQYSTCGDGGETLKEWKPSDPEDVLLMKNWEVWN